MRRRVILIVVALGVVPMAFTGTAGHGSRLGAGLDRPTGPVAPSECATCHPGVLSHDFVHSPLKLEAGACTACHLVDDVDSHTYRMIAEGRELCRQCHDLTTPEPMSIHQPFEQGDCLSCHDPHGGSQAATLRASSVDDLCRNCHEDVTGNARHVHGPVAIGGCLDCHEVHHASSPGLLVNSGPTLCLECHDREMDRPDGTTIANVGEIIESASHHHGTVVQDDCAACHESHAGDHFRLLTAEYPSEFYVPFAVERYALCFGCHDSGLVEDERTVTSTEFRNGDVNLHFRHVNGEKGRSCGVCHVTHGGSHEKLMRDAVPFGRRDWRLDIGFDKTDTGGSCATGCHRTYRYDRVTPVEFRSAPR